MTGQTIKYIQHRLSNLAYLVDSMSTEEIKKSLNRINEDLGEIAMEMYCRSMSVQHFTGVKSEDYNKWFWSQKVPEIMGDTRKTDVLSDFRIREVTEGSIPKED